MNSVNFVPETPEEVLTALSEEDLRELAFSFSLPESLQQKNPSFYRLYGGMRNAVVLAKFSEQEMFVLTIYKPSPTARQRVRRSLGVSKFLCKKDFLVPCFLETKHNKDFLELELLGVKRYISFHRFRGGRKIFPYGLEQIVPAGKFLSQLHKALREFPSKELLRPFPEEEINGDQEFTVLHMDYARGNILFDLDGTEVVGVLDFEEATWGPPVADIGKSLAISTKDNKDLSRRVMVDCFLDGYNSGPLLIEDRKLVNKWIDHFAPMIV
ncbi:MAG: phosphotransferase enzyme family protein [Patescibacteria group bacterium]